MTWENRSTAPRTGTETEPKSQTRPTSLRARSHQRVRARPAPWDRAGVPPPGGGLGGVGAARRQVPAMGTVPTEAALDPDRHLGRSSHHLPSLQGDVEVVGRRG